jgi:hypothetical protein
MSLLPTDIWEHLCRLFAANPQTVWPLVYVCKRTRRAFFRVFGCRYDSWVAELEMCADMLTGASKTELTRRPCADAWLNTDRRALIFDQAYIDYYGNSLGTLPESPSNSLLMCAFLPQLTPQQRVLLTTFYIGTIHPPHAHESQASKEKYTERITLVRCALQHNILILGVSCLGQRGGRTNMFLQPFTARRNPPPLDIFYSCIAHYSLECLPQKFDVMPLPFCTHALQMELDFLACYNYESLRRGIIN